MLAFMNSRFNRAMKSMLIPLGHTASAFPVVRAAPEVEPLHLRAPSAGRAASLRLALRESSSGRLWRGEQHRGADSGLAATPARRQPAHVAASMEAVGDLLSGSMELRLRARYPFRAEMKPPASLDLVEGAAIRRDRDCREDARAKGSTTSVSPSSKWRKKEKADRPLSAHAGERGRRRRSGSHTFTDALATIAVEERARPHSPRREGRPFKTNPRHVKKQPCQGSRRQRDRSSGSSLRALHYRQIFERSQHPLADRCVGWTASNSRSGSL